MIRGRQTSSIHTHVILLLLFNGHATGWFAQFCALHKIYKNEHIYYCNLFRATNESQKYRQNARQEIHIAYTQYTRWHQ